MRKTMYKICSHILSFALLVGGLTTGNLVASNRANAQVQTEIEDGVYQVPVSVLKTSSEDASMTDKALAKDYATVEVKEGKAAYRISFKPLAIGSTNGHLLTLYVYESDTKSETITAATGDYYTDAGTEYPGTFIFSREKVGEKEIYIRVSVDAMAGFDQDARLVFNWEQAEKTDTSASLKPPMTQTGGDQGSTTATPTPVPTQKPSDQKVKKGQTVTVGKLTYKVTAAGANATVECTGSKTTQSSVTIPATVKIHGVTCKVTSIAANSFKNNKKLTSVVLGKNVTKIGKNAFQGAKKLKKITVKTKKLNSIGKNAFKGIVKKSTVKLPGGLKQKKRTVLKKKFKNAGLPAKAAVK